MLDLSDLTPTSLRHIVGQRSVVEQVLVGVEAAFADNKKFDHSLLVGPPGVGKTALAKVIADEMATEFTGILGQSLKNRGDLNAILLDASDKSIVFIDEAHELDRRLQTALYLALDQRKLSLSSCRKDGVPSSVPLADFTLLLASTDEYCLLQPLRDRMKLVLRFDFYAVEDLTVIVRHRIRSLAWWVEEDVIPLIAERARGTPRVALRLLQSCRRVCRSEGESVVTRKHLQRACELEQLDCLGLGPTEQRYLHLVGQGSNRLNVLASILGLPPRTVSLVTEPFLIRAGLVVKDDEGKRRLTPSGREHLSKSCP
jgi:Holliday junction DNA helicase RuvB